MTEVFADTYYFISLLGSAGSEQRKAADATGALNGPVVTTTWIIVELGNFLHRLQNRVTFLRAYDSLLADPNFVVLETTQILFERGINLFRARPGKEWSLTDCISFVAMRERRIIDALTADHHFEQAGFNAILK